MSSSLFQSQDWRRRDSNCQTSDCRLRL